MDVLETGQTVADEVETLKKHWEDYDFFYFHVKKRPTLTVKMETLQKRSKSSKKSIK